MPVTKAPPPRQSNRFFIGLVVTIILIVIMAYALQYARRLTGVVTPPPEVNHNITPQINRVNDRDILYATLQPDDRVMVSPQIPGIFRCANDAAVADVRWLTVPELKHAIIGRPLSEALPLYGAQVFVYEYSPESVEQNRTLSPAERWIGNYNTNPSVSPREITQMKPGYLYYVQSSTLIMFQCGTTAAGEASSSSSSSESSVALPIDWDDPTYGTATLVPVEDGSNQFDTGIPPAPGWQSYREGAYLDLYKYVNDYQEEANTLPAYQYDGVMDYQFFNWERRPSILSFELGYLPQDLETVAGVKIKGQTGPLYQNFLEWNGVPAWLTLSIVQEDDWTPLTEEVTASFGTPEGVYLPVLPGTTRDQWKHAKLKIFYTGYTRSFGEVISKWQDVSIQNIRAEVKYNKASEPYPYEPIAGAQCLGITVSYQHRNQIGVTVVNEPLEGFSPVYVTYLNIGETIWQPGEVKLVTQRSFWDRLISNFPREAALPVAVPPGKAYTFTIDNPDNCLITSITTNGNFTRCQMAFKLSYNNRLIGDSCSASTSILNDPTLDPVITQSTMNPSLCGNGVIDPLEQCDDGNTNDGDSCFSTCLKVIPDSPTP